MPQNDFISAAFLNAWEAVCLLAYGLASENGGEDWREAEIAKGRREEDIIVQEELDRFSWAKRTIERAGQAEKIHAHGRRSSHSEIQPVPEVDFIDRHIDVFGENGGSLAGAIEDDDGSLDLTQLAADHDRAQWVGLRFKRAEIEKLRTAYRFVDPAATPPETTAERNQKWATRAKLMHDRGMTWKAAGEAIGTSDTADGGYVAWVVRRVRKRRKRENGNPN